jgi:uncharacterized protein (TIGR02271 family)
MAYEKIAAVYDTAAHAEAAVKGLTAAGISSDEISTLAKNTLRGGAEAAAGLKEPGFWHRVFGGDIEHHEATVYGRTVDNGGVVVSVRAPETEVPRIMDVLDVHKPVDVADRAKAYGLSMPVAAVAPTVAASAAAASAPAVRTATDSDEVIRLAEEQLNVGKRTVAAGTTRVRRFVTEKDVEANVTLHEEHAEVLRRAISDPTYVKDIDWSERTIEVAETAEQAVVSKSARIAEEVVVRKEGTDHVETVHDKIRRQQVEVERSSAADAAAAGKK